MRNLLALLGLAVVVFVAAGYYFGWYKFDSTTNRDGTRDIHLQVDTDKMTKDAQTGIGKVEDAVSHTADSLKKNQSDAKPTELVGPPAPTAQR